MKLRRSEAPIESERQLEVISPETFLDQLAALEDEHDDDTDDDARS